MDAYAQSEDALRRAVANCARQTPSVITADSGRQLRSTAEPCSKPCWKELRAQVIEFARVMHDQGAPPEVVLREVKSVLRHGPSNVDPRSAMMTAAVAWCIEGYYSAAQQSQPNAEALAPEPSQPAVGAPIDIALDEQARRLVVRIVGSIDVGVAVRTIGAAAGVLASRGWGSLADLRAMEYVPTLTELRTLATEFGRFRAAFVGGVAFVVSSNVHYSLGRLLAFLAKQRGITIAVFREPDEAEVWLTAAGPKRGEE